MLKKKYGSYALIAGASEGLGAAFARQLAAAGMNLVMIARRKEPLTELAESLASAFNVSTHCIEADLARPDVSHKIIDAINAFQIDIDMLVYNAGNSYIDHFENKPLEVHMDILQTNMITPLHLIHHYAPLMIDRKRGAIILMASLAGFQGTPYIATYAATKAFDQILAESLWYEWKDHGVDVMACCAGSTATPNFINTNPGKQNFFAPKAQTPDAVVTECLKRLGTTPSFISGRSNKIASFFMQRVLSRKKAVTVMGDTTKKMYRIK